MRIEFTKDDESLPSQFLGEGRFNCRISKVENKTTKKDGSPMIEVEFTDLATAKTTRDWFVLGNGFNKFKLLQLVKSAQLNVQAFDTEQLFGKTVQLTRRKTGTREYNGKSYDDYDTEYSVSMSLPPIENIPF